MSMLALEYDLRTGTARAVEPRALREQLASDLGVELEDEPDYSTPYQFEGSRALYVAIYGEPPAEPGAPPIILRRVWARRVVLRPRTRASRRARRAAAERAGPPEDGDPPPPAVPARARGGA